MALNPNYDQIGKHFVQQYYAIMDDNHQRLNVANFYSVIYLSLLYFQSLII